MTIHRLIQNLAFNQDDIERLAAAYEEALLALHISDRDDPNKQSHRTAYHRRSPRWRARSECSMPDGGQGPYGPIASTFNSSGRIWIDVKRRHAIDQVRIQEFFASKKHNKHRQCSGISATRASNIMALHQKERISDTN